MSLGRRALVFGLLLVFTASANAALTIPAPPTWWTFPPDPFTRLQYHSFQADPNLNQPPDYTYDGFVPSVPDLWTLPTPGQGITYNVAPPNVPWGSFWQGIPGQLNDNIGATLSGPSTLTKHMGNLHDPTLTKEFYALVIWTMNASATTTLTMGVTSQAGTAISSTQTDYADGTWFATVLEGTIDPQPDWEDFTFAFSGTAFIDSIYVGTHCFPEPTTLSLLAMGGVVLLRRRR